MRLIVTCLVSAVLMAGPTLAQERERGWLGVFMGDGRTADDGTGILLRRIVADSPAADAGLRARDIVVRINGRDVGDRSALAAAAAEAGPGGWLQLEIERDGETLDRRVRLDERPTDRRNVRVRQGWVGAQVIDLPAPLREHFGAPGDSGVMVAEVAPGSPAESAGMRLGDVVWEIAGERSIKGGMFRELTTFGGIGNELEVKLARDGVAIALDLLVIERPEEPAPRPDSGE